MWNRSANSEDQVHQLASCSRMWMVCSPACILTSSTSTSMSSGLARASWTSMELFEMDTILPHGGTARLPRSAENRGSKTVIGNTVERLGEFGNHLVIRTPGTEYYLMIDKADRNSQVFPDRFFFRRFFPIGFFGPANQSG